MAACRCRTKIIRDLGSADRQRIPVVGDRHLCKLIFVRFRQLEASNNRAIWTKEPGIRLWRGRLVTAIGMPTRGRLG